MHFLQISVPVPKDIPLPLPLPEWALVVLLIFSFLLHIVFINLMVGGALVTLWAQLKGLKNKDYDVFAHEIAKTITVNKSLAVVLGVAPLLTINTLYTLYFYSANALTGFAWIMIIPLVTVAFLLTYLHKYTWDKLRNNKQLHIAIMGAACFIFLAIPFIFLTNVNLMLFPEKWATVKGFFSAMMLPNVLPRYGEFLGSCLSITGLFIVWYNGRKNYLVEEMYASLSRIQLKRLGFSIATIGLSIQILFGLIILFTLPSKGMAFDVLFLIIVAGSTLVFAFLYSYKALNATDWQLRRYFNRVLGLMVAFLILYGGSRQLYRQNALAKHRELVRAHTEEFQLLSKEARENERMNTSTVADSTLGELAAGASIFKANCSACHQYNKKLVGPPITEMVSIYSNNEVALIEWIMKPGKKRTDSPQMPGFSNLSRTELESLSEYILNTKE